MAKHKQLNRKWVYKGSRIDFAVDTIQIEGIEKQLKREVILHSKVAVIIPVLDDGRLILIKQFRYSTGKYFWEFPAGTCDGAERPLTCAKRELIEETNFQAKHFKKIFDFYPTPGISTEQMFLYLATQLTPKKGVPDEDEDIQVYCFKPSTIESMIQNHKIKDAKTILAYSWLKLKKII